MNFFSIYYKNDYDTYYHRIGGLFQMPETDDNGVLISSEICILATEQSILNWNKAVKIANGNKLSWFITCKGMPRTFCFRGIPIAINQNDLVGNKKEVNIAEFSDGGWEHFAIKYDEVFKN